MPLCRWLAASLVTLWLLTLTQAAGAQSEADKSTARSLAQEGQVALEKGDFTRAEDRFRRADALYHVPSVALGLAQAQVGLRRLVAAQETYKTIVREGVPPKANEAMVRAVSDAKKELAALEPRVPSVVFAVEGPSDPNLFLDGSPLSNAVLGVRRPIDPGEHRFRAAAAGFKTHETTFVVSEGQTQNVKLRLDAAPPPPAIHPMPPPARAVASGDAGPGQRDRASSVGGTWMKPVGVTAIVVGSVGLAAGVVTGILAIGEHNVLEQDCSFGECPPERRDTLDNFRTLSTISTISVVVGVVGLGGGITLVALAPSKRGAGATREPTKPGAQGTARGRPQPALHPYVGLGRAGVLGRF